MKKKVHIVCYTHWDREFRWEFEHTRMKLVQCLDNLLDIMKDDDYKSFLMDGQMVLIDDYLEIRPEKQDEIQKLVDANRLEIGPWYTLPDCATPNGESVIRNLALGVQRASDFGTALNCGYNVFSFGQIGQLPQIYANFGIDVIIFYKYMNPVRSKLPEFIWEAPDGTQAYASRLGREARWNYFFAGHIPIVYDRDPWHKDWHYDYGTMGKVFHTADPDGYGWFHEILDPQTSFHKDKIKEGFQRTLDTLTDTAVPESLLFFCGTDFTEPHPLTVDMIREMQQQCGGKEYDIQHSTLAAYLSEMKQALAKRKDLQTVKGPMRDGPVGSVHSDVVSIHPEIKLMNARTENTLIRYAEPLATAAFAMGIDRYPDTYLAKAWKLLFTSQVHDSMHGLGPKEMGQSSVAKMRQAGIIASGVERKALGDITKEINTSKIKDAEVFLAVHNTAAFERSEVVEAFVDVPADVVLKDLIIEDEKGKACRIQEIHREKTRGGIYHPRSRNMPYYCTRVHLHFMADAVPALGYKTYKVKWTAKNEYPYPHEDWDAPRIVTQDLLVGPNMARNELVELKIHDDGTFDVTDLKTGQTYRKLNYFLDGGDCGNMWMQYTPEQDVLVNSLGTPARITCTARGELAACFTIEKQIVVPARFDFTLQARSSETVTINVLSELKLTRGSRYVEVTTTVNNTARDHHFKVCFPTGLDAKTTAADGSFSVTEYSTTPDLRSELARHPAQLWFDTSDGKNGLAVLSRSTKDYEILDNADGKTMAMGLTRGVRLRIPCDNRLWMDYPGDESAQGLDTTRHQYAVLPHAKSWQDADLYTDALRFNQPLKACQFGKQTGKLGLSHSFVEISNPKLVLSAVKKAEASDSVLVRLFNPTGAKLETKLTVGFDFDQVRTVKMNEQADAKLTAKGKSVSLSVGKGQILTVEFTGKGK